MAITFAVSQWSGWSPANVAGDAPSGPVSRDPKPDVAAIPPMLRRRLNLLGRAAASQMLQLLPEKQDVPVVYCSRHGDIERTLTVLASVVDGEPVSPMHFSLAVHNAICGVVSIHRGMTANISAIASAEGLVPVLLEAAALLSPATPRVLCVLADTTLPDVYCQTGEEPGTPFAIGFMVTRDEGVTLSLSTDGTVPKRTTSPLSFVEFLTSPHQRLLANHNGLSWQIDKV